ncbi:MULTISPECIES: DUF934 domain-containing protein [Microbulbifer]|uniref:DUF934 domain-containing protein n=1 Tax=Microbulbifer TaxID=48073 RepID=UPI001E4E774E|nr:MULTISPECIES: DUF934 domain-containing protein [Microbulbifer]UHQ55573.1 DUF934 domain-containing protein [Microbulbifer sp. YPW16]
MPKPKAGPQPQNPAQLIRGGAVASNEWRLLPASDEAPEITADTLAPGKVILPFPVWQRLREDLSDRSGEIGVWLDSNETADLLGEAARELPLVAVHFPAFADGRGFTTGRLLRERFGFTGELRAVGAFIRDQLTYLRRCGFDAYAYEGEESLEDLLPSLHDFSDSYQAAVDESRPIFRRRPLAG